MSQNSNRLSIQHAINTKARKGDDLNMSDFSPLKFLKLYLSGDIPGSCKLYMLQLTKSGINTFNAIYACINFINSKSDFTVIGWYKRVTINDQSLIAARKINSRGNTNGNAKNTNNNISNNDVQVDYGNISYNFVHIAPTNRNFLDYTTGLGQELEELNFNVSEIGNM